jgi:hypothetical protein
MDILGISAVILGVIGVPGAVYGYLGYRVAKSERTKKEKARAAAESAYHVSYTMLIILKPAIDALPNSHGWTKAIDDRLTELRRLKEEIDADA